MTHHFWHIFKFYMHQLRLSEGRAMTENIAKAARYELLVIRGY